MGRNKKKDIQRHAYNRCWDRFGFCLGKQEQEELVSLIQSHQADFVEKQSLRITLWDVKYRDKSMRLVYDKKRKKIVTVLYQDGKKWLYAKKSYFI